MTGARLLIVDGHQGLRHSARDTLPDVLRPGDLVVANDAATLPASLHGTHAPTRQVIEVRLAGWRTHTSDVAEFCAVVFGAVTTTRAQRIVHRRPLSHSAIDSRSAPSLPA
jgi:S-adenosylmethionine:tRNA ribosyltransferase-isomerase